MSDEQATYDALEGEELASADDLGDGAKARGTDWTAPDPSPRR